MLLDHLYEFSISNNTLRYRRIVQIITLICGSTANFSSPEIVSLGTNLLCIDALPILSKDYKAHWVPLTPTRISGSLFAPDLASQNSLNTY